MSAEYAPGTVAVATVRGVEGVRVSRYADGWARLDDPDNFYNDDAEYVTDVCPLVVLDLGRMYDGCDMGGWGYVVRTLRDPRAKAIVTREDIADQIEAQTKPTRIPEPGLWGATVREYNGDGFPWTRFSDSESHNEGDWINHDGLRHQWAELVDPVLIREGVESDD